MSPILFCIARTRDTLLVGLARLAFGAAAVLSGVLYFLDFGVIFNEISLYSQSPSLTRWARLSFDEFGKV